MNVWNVRYAVSGLNPSTSTLSVVLLSVARKPEQLQSKSTNRPRRVSYHSRDGLKVLLGQIVNGGIGKVKKVSMGQLSGLLDTQRKTRIRKPSGISSIGIEGVAPMLAIWIGKQYQTSLKHLVTNASYAERLNGLRLTTYLHCQKAVQTILTTYSRYASPVTLGRATDENYL